MSQMSEEIRCDECARRMEQINAYFETQRRIENETAGWGESLPSEKEVVKLVIGVRDHECKATEEVQELRSAMADEKALMAWIAKTKDDMESTYSKNAYRSSAAVYELYEKYRLGGFLARRLFAQNFTAMDLWRLLMSFRKDAPL